MTHSCPTNQNRKRPCLPSSSPPFRSTKSTTHEKQGFRPWAVTHINHVVNDDEECSAPTRSAAQMPREVLSGLVGPH
jgi:hypothetical protein